MNLTSIKLDNRSYHDYLEGKEIVCATSSLSNKEIHEGEHVMVFKDTVAVNTNISPPKSEMQSQYIGVEGKVTHVELPDGDRPQIMIQKI
jgi:hypothetical protein